MKKILPEFKNNSLEFDYIAFSYRNPEKNNYKYKMEGFDSDWIDAGNRRFVSYNNLPIGDFIFRVQGSNDGPDKGNLLSINNKYSRILLKN